MKGFCDRNLHPAGKQAKGHKALDATAWTTKGVLILSLKQLLAKNIRFPSRKEYESRQNSSTYIENSIICSLKIQLFQIL